MPPYTYTGPYANSPMYNQPGTAPLYSYSYGQDPAYGLYGQNPYAVIAESPYARMTGQWTALSSAAIPNLASFMQPTFVDMNGFTGNTGIPMLPSFIGSTSMMNPEQPLYNTFNDYLAQQQAAYYTQPQSYGYTQPQSYSYTQPQSYGYTQPQSYGYTQPPVQYPPTYTNTTSLSIYATTSNQTPGFNLVV